MNTLINKLREVIQKEVSTLNQPILDYIEENNDTGLGFKLKTIISETESVLFKYQFYNDEGILIIIIDVSYSGFKFTVDFRLKNDISSKKAAFAFLLKAFIEDLIEEFENK